QLSSGHEGVGILAGLALCRMDGTPLPRGLTSRLSLKHPGSSSGELDEELRNAVYRPWNYYLVFPPSVMFVYGWIKLQNNGRMPIELHSMERKKPRRIAAYQLRPYGTEIFRFKGHWCIEIVSGNPYDLLVPFPLPPLLL